VAVPAARPAALATADTLAVVLSRAVRSSPMAWSAWAAAVLWASAPPATCTTAALRAVIWAMASALSLLCWLVPRATSSMERAICWLAWPTCWLAWASCVEPAVT
jgi:hypothetical protein